MRLYKKAWESSKSFPTLVIGFILGAFGIVPFLNNLGVIGFNLPFTPAGKVLAVLLSLGGLFLIFGGLREIIDPSFSPLMGWIAIIFGLLIVAVGIAGLGILPFAMPAFLLTIPANILFVIIGILLIILSFAY